MGRTAVFVKTLSSGYLLRVNGTNGACRKVTAQGDAQRSWECEQVR